MKPTKKKYQEPTWKDWVIGIGLIVIYISVIGIGAIFLIPKYWKWWVIIFLASTILLVLNQNINYGCRCRECGYEFEVSFLINLISPHGIDKEGSWQWVKCPSCNKRVRVTVIKVVKDK